MGEGPGAGGQDRVQLRWDQECCRKRDPLTSLAARAAPWGTLALPVAPHFPSHPVFQVGHPADQGTENPPAAAAPNVQKERDSGVGT